MNLKTNNTSNLVFCVIMIALCATGFWFGGTRLAAEYHFEKAKAQVEQWENLDAVYRLDEWNAATNHIRDAIRLNSRRAEFHLYKAFVYEWGLQAPFPNDPGLTPLEQLNRTAERVESFRRNALQAYRDSLARRPASAQSWIGLADTKGQLGEFDDEFEHAYTMANVHAENLQFYQNSLSFLAARYFQAIQMTQSARAVQLDYLGRKLASAGAMSVLGYLERFGVLGTACTVFMEENLPMSEAAMARCLSAGQ